MRSESWPSVWPGVCQTFEFEIADGDRVAVVDQMFDHDGRHVEVDVLGGDLGKGGELVARFEIFRRLRMAGDGGFENLFRFGQPLNVIGRRRASAISVLHWLNGKSSSRMRSITSSTASS